MYREYSILRNKSSIFPLISELDKNKGTLTKTKHQWDLIISGFIRALFRDTGKQAQNLKDFTKIKQHVTYKNKITNSTYCGISMCM